MEGQVNVVCMKWGTKYGAEYVNVLRAMVRRHLVRAHRFVCLTDDSRGLGDDIEVMALPGELYRPENIGGLKAAAPGGLAASRPGARHPERGWMKVGIFRPRLGNLHGPTLFLDLDVLIVESIDAFFDYPGEFCLSPDYTWRGKRETVGNTSVFRLEIGAHPEVYEHFLAHRAKIVRRFRNEQEYVSHRLGNLSFWPEAWCPSFKRHCLPAWPRNYFQPPRIPPGARVIIFHGRPNPPEALQGRSGKWYRHCRPAPWVADHWRE
jgi:hypothetical protein